MGNKLKQIKEDAARDAILDTAVKMILNDGASSVTMRGLAKKVGCSPATLYKHFEHKEGLMEAIRSTAPGLSEYHLDAAARYMRDLYDEFGDWYLALAGYNAGEGRVRRSVRKSGTTDFWELSRRHFFRRETRNRPPCRSELKEGCGLKK